jgi:NADPH:quinone reductase-like Zn-dependent oxidoreductase
VFSIQLLKSWGHFVVASCGERNVEKLTRLGCDQVLDYRSSQFQQFLDVPESVDVVLDTVGGAKSEARGLRVVRPGGHYLSLRGAFILLHLSLLLLCRGLAAEPPTTQAHRLAVPPGPLANMTDSGGLVGGLLSAATTIAQKKLAAFTQGHLLLSLCLCACACVDARRRISVLALECSRHSARDVTDRRHVQVDYVIYKPNGDALREVGKLVEAGRIRPDIDRAFDLDDIREAHQYLESGHARGKVVVKVNV